MASLSTCHLGLWLGWQILLNLKSPFTHTAPFHYATQLPDYTHPPNTHLPVPGIILLRLSATPSLFLTFFRLSYLTPDTRLIFHDNSRTPLYASPNTTRATWVTCPCLTPPGHSKAPYAPTPLNIPLLFHRENNCFCTTPLRVLSLGDAGFILLYSTGDRFSLELVLYTLGTQENAPKKNKNKKGFSLQKCYVNSKKLCYLLV